MSIMGFIPTQIEKAKILQAIASGSRLDGRKLNEMRKIKITTGYISKAAGSAYVELGDTKVVAGVKVSIGSPFPDMPDEGLFVINAEFVPTASPFFEPGPPDENSIELARVVDRGVRHAEIIDTKKLCIIPGEKVYTIFADIYVIDHSGNLFDASSLAVVSALLTAKIPKAEVSDNGDVTLTDEYIPLPVRRKEVSLTWVKIGNALVLDPTFEEESIADARYTLSIDDEGILVSMQKGGSGYLTSNDIDYAIEESLKISKELIKLLPGGEH
ncbi:MAG: exosome complex protein Rrp42 [Candidatus Asgardarchaeia archaeon]